MDDKRPLVLTITTLKTQFIDQIQSVYDKNEAESIFFICTQHYLNLSKIEIALQPNYELTKAQTQLFSEVITQLKQNKPIQYIIGQTEFYGLTFKVDKNVLIPRQETEELVDWVLKSYELRVKSSELLNPKSQIPNRQSSIANRKFRILDIGTGSGCIAVSLAKHLPNAKVYALDVSKEALKIAQQNAKANAVNINFINSNVLTDLSSQFQPHYFDVIVSNPPYVRHLEKPEIHANVLDYEPHLALLVDNKKPLQFYEAITNFALKHLKPKGQLFFEINQYLGTEMLSLVKHYGFKHAILKQDINDNDRMLRVENC